MLLAVIGMIFFITWPLYQRITNVQASISSAMGQIEVTQNLLTVLDQLEKQFGALQSDVQKVEVAIPKEEQLPELLVMMPLLVAQNGLKLTSIDFGSPAQESSYRTVTISIVASGSYLNMQAFLRAIEQNLRIIDIVTLGVSPGDSKDDYGFDFVLKTYFQ